MQQIVLFDVDDNRLDLLPLTFTRPVSAIRVGILTIREKWERRLPGTYFDQTAPYLQVKFPAPVLEPADGGVLAIASHLIPTDDLIEAIALLPLGSRLTSSGRLLAYRAPRLLPPDRIAGLTEIDYPDTPIAILSLPDIFLINGAQIEADFELITRGCQSLPLSPSCTVIGDPSRIFIEEGAQIEGAILNTRGGDIYIGKDAEVMEGSIIRAPFAMCSHSVVNMGTKIYPDTTLGPWCKVGGELNNVVMIGYSNKAHDGFLGNAVIGEWCNLGAGCVASNLKNDYTPIRLWNYRTRHFAKTGLQFCGLIMGDHSKAGINTMFNTATVVAVGCNIHGAGFPRNFIPSFSEGGSAGFNNVSLPKFFDIARRVMARRHMQLTEADEAIYHHIFDFAEDFK
ncbi:MAG: GlmU family protein [Muribaculaceae bacterium]|nr:GlmU family protein [Muribaculaceae bacterium]